MRMTMNWAMAAASLYAVASACTAQATPVTYVDTYYGGNDGSYNTDVIGNKNVFDIFSMIVEKVSTNLVVTINTNYSGNNVGNLGTRLGALFIGDPSKLNYNGADMTIKHNDDTFKADTDRFSYGFDFDKKNNPGKPGVNSGTGSLYALSGTGDDVLLSQDFFPNNNGIRRDQAVDVNRNKAEDTGINGTWAIGLGNVNFTITNFFGGGLPALYNTGLTLAWAMTCSNDIILARVTFPKDSTPEVPLPAGALLLFSGLGGLGFLGKLRNKGLKATA